MSKTNPSKLEHLLNHYQQWMKDYEQRSLEDQTIATQQYQTIKKLVIQLQQIPEADNLQDPILIGAIQDFWRAVRYAQALLAEDIK
ncbi:MAG: hypothetical protein ACRBFS_10360 [Aureispira sp.]